MNTGIGDAVNLAWKLAAVLGGAGGAAPARLLRGGADPVRPVPGRDDRPDLRGRRRPGPARPAGPDRLRPVHPAVRAAVRGRPPGPVPARLPDPDRVPGEPAERRVGRRGPRRRPPALGRGGRQLRPAEVARLAAPRLRQGDRRPARVRGGSATAAPRVALDRAARRAGLAEDAVYLVRPDGHVGFARRTPDVEGLRAYLGRFGIVGR